MDNFIYQGGELEVFKFAKNWKIYYKSLLVGHLGQHSIIEIGAGIGEITKCFRPLSDSSSWICVEPDKSNSTVIEKLIFDKVIDDNITVFTGTLKEFDANGDKFETVLFIDSLEHIEEDEKTLKAAADILLPEGKIIIIAPAHNFLFSEFDRKIGHYRRYNKKSLRAIIPEGMQEVSFKYIDSIGFFLNLTNKYMLKSANPKLNQILFWDRCIVPVSKFVDRIFNYNFGKNIVLVIKK